MLTFIVVNWFNNEKAENHMFSDGIIIKVGPGNVIPSFDKLNNLHHTQQKHRGALLSKQSEYSHPSDADIIKYIQIFNGGDAMVGLHRAMKYFHRVMTNLTHKCEHYRRFGNRGDGGYEVCLDPPLIRRDGYCVLFSFGINNDFSFDDSVGRRLKCKVHSFDPSMKVKDYARSSHAYFHNIGIGAANYKTSSGWIMYRFSDIRSILGYGVIDIVKLDVEQSDWPVLKDIIDSGEASMFIKQIAIETHSVTFKHENVHLGDYLTMLKIIHSLEQAGFKKYLVHARNNCCGVFSVMVTKEVGKTGKDLCCYELFFVNSRFM